jgi:hypothetical protein
MENENIKSKLKKEETIKRAKMYIFLFGIILGSVIGAASYFVD